MKQKLKKEDTGFTQVSNIILNDKNLSWKAKGIWAYLYSKPENWDFSGKRISNDSLDAEKATYSGLKELEQNGYIKRVKEKTGRVIYYIQYSQMSKTAISQNRKQPKRQLAKTATISNKDNKIIKNINNTILSSKEDKAKPNSFGRNDINKCLKEIEKITKLDGSDKMNRFYIKNFIDSKIVKVLEEKGVLNPTIGQKIGGIVKIFKIAKEDEFHSRNITSIKYVYNNVYKIINADKKSVNVYKL